MSGALDDIKGLRNLLLGVVAFATTISAFLINFMNFESDKTIVATALIAILVLIVGFLIDKSEKRTMKIVTKHMSDSDAALASFNKKCQEINESLLEIRRSSVRTEMNFEIARNPQNHDTITRYAYQYFKILDGDWVETEIFEKWRASEKEAGREVFLPKDLLANIGTKVQTEKENANKPEWFKSE